MENSAHFVKQVNIVDVILFCNDKTECLSAFTHLLPKNIKSKFSDSDAVACLIALGTNHGIHKMSKISSISYDTLDNSRKALFNIENIEECCNILSNSVEKLEAFEGYNINNYLHGGIDGQKHKTKSPVPSAVTSQKYYHLGPSFTANTLLVNHVPVNAVAFGSNNHESRYVFDLVYNNETDIQPEIISTDNAGVNAVNFALLDMLSKTFAPCFKQITNKDSMIVGFKKPASYKDYFLRPSRQAKKQLIIDEWDGIKKIGASLAMKKSSQSILIRKLCGTSRKNTTKEALWEYDAVIRSNYILKYIDDEKLRISVRTALNRNEAYHQLKRAISTVNSESVLGKSDDNVMLNDQCSRLLSLMVIYYNGYLLSEIIKIKQNAGITDELKYYKHISLVAWTHINFHGYYNFERQVTKESIEQMIEEIASLSPVVTG